jgi:hypothetical protein
MYFNYSEELTRGESLVLEWTVNVKYIPWQDYFSKVGSENFVCPTFISFSYY